jgi:hypothetical protein
MNTLHLWNPSVCYCGRKRNIHGCGNTVLVVIVSLRLMCVTVTPRTDGKRALAWPWPFFSGVGLSPLGTAATSGLLYKPQMIDEGDCGAIGGMKIGRENRSTRRKPAPAPLCPPQIPHDQTRARTRAAAVGSQRLTAWAMARPDPDLGYSNINW